MAEETQKGGGVVPAPRKGRAARAASEGSAPYASKAAFGAATRASKDVSTRKLAASIREIGAPGTIFSAGVISGEDLNAKWDNPRSRNRIIEEMRTTDGQVQASLLVCKMPLLASTWLIKPHADATKEEQEHSDFANENLNGMTQSWTETLQQMLTMFDFGFSLFEKVFVVKNGKLWWKKWAHRKQSTISKWNVDPDGGLYSVTQSTYKNGEWRDIPIGIDSLLLFTLGKEGANHEGRSLLRSAFIHHQIKNRLYRIDAIAQERHGVGVPMITVPDGAGDAEMALAEAILENWRSHEKGYIVKPASILAEIMAIPTQLRDPMVSIKHHDEKIATSVLAQFINLGFSQSGSRALGQSFSDFFLASLNSYANYIEGIINRHAIPQLIEINFGPQERYPELKCVPVAGINFESMARSLMVLAQTGLVKPGKDVIEHVHEIMGLPRPDPNEEPMVVPIGTQSSVPGATPKGNGGQPPDDSEDKPKPKESAPEGEQRGLANRLATFVDPVIALQIENLSAAASNGHNGRFRAPLEGTLLQAMATCNDNGATEPMEKAAREYARRLAAAAELAVSCDGSESVRKSVEEEAERSKPILVAAMSAKAKTEATA